MFLSSEKQKEGKSEQVDAKIHALAAQLETLDKETLDIFSQLKLTPEQLRAFVESPENFTECEWTELEKQQKELEERMQLLLNNTSSKQKRGKGTPRKDWLFVR